MPVTTTCLLRADCAADLARAAEMLRAGQLVAIPTETVYGLAADARQPRAVAGIFAAKGRPAFDPLIVHVPDLAAADTWVELEPEARKLAEAFWPGPLTLVAPRRPETAIGDLVCAGLPSLGIRVPDKASTLALLRACGLPLAAPSANRFGSISPTSAADVQAELDGRIEAILDDGACERGIESTVVKIEHGRAVVLRLGALPASAIAETLGVAEVEVRCGTSHPGQAPEAPGQVERHYAPATPLGLFKDWADLPAKPAPNLGLLTFGEVPAHVTGAYAAVRHLSRQGDSVEAAAHLFAALRALDGSGVEGIHAILPPEDAQGGLGPAIRDRLTRAAVR